MNRFVRALAAALGMAVAGCSSVSTSVPVAAPAGFAPEVTSSAAFGFAPYVDMTSSPPPSLARYAKATGTRYFTLGFVQSYKKTRCAGAWGGTVLPNDPANGPYFAKQLAAIRAMGGDGILSFGGAAGVDLASACHDPASLAAAYEALIDYYHVTHVDFDIEGNQPYDLVAVARRSQALVAVQQHYAGTTPLAISYTLPVEPKGMPQAVLDVVKSAAQGGLKLAIVNAMTMDFGDANAPNPSGRMGTYAIEAAKHTAAQLRSIGFAGANAYAVVGVTPMIGQNDTTSEVFEESDAAKLVAWAKASRVGRLAFWAAQRDKSCPGGANPHASDTCSGIVQKPNAFGKIFAGF